MSKTIKEHNYPLSTVNSQLPKGWEIKKLGEVCENLDSKRIPITQNKRKKGDIPYYGASGIVDYVSDFIFNEDLLCVSEDGANLLARTYPIAFPISGKTWVNNHAHVLKFPNLVTQKIVEIYLNSIRVDDYVSGMAQPKLNQAMLNKIKIPLPPLPEQQRIVSILDEAFAAIAQAKANAEQNLKNAKELFESYLQGVFENGNWETKTIQEITKIVNGYAFASKDFKPTNTIKSVKITNVGVKEFVEEADNYLPEKFKETLKDFQVREGNIVIALTRTIISAGLKVAVVPKSYDGALVNQRVAALVSNEKLVNQNFLYYYLTTSVVAKYVLAHVNTLMQPNLSINDLKNMHVPCPSLIEQQSIVRQLDALRAETQKLEAIYRQKLLNLEELKKSLLQKAFNGELSSGQPYVVALKGVPQRIAPTN
ncbi:MAG: restriction endonuclease subunit S [Bacteroidales bacterium]|nr:restriction endonuclease subunit S [Bacteroidales bacterium]